MPSCTYLKCPPDTRCVQTGYNTGECRRITTNKRGGEQTVKSLSDLINDAIVGPFKALIKLEPRDITGTRKATEEAVARQSPLVQSLIPQRNQNNDGQKTNQESQTPYTNATTPGTTTQTQPSSSVTAILSNPRMALIFGAGAAILIYLMSRR